MNTNSSNTAAGGGVLICTGVIWLAITLMLIFHTLASRQADALLDAHGHSAPARIQSVVRIPGQTGGASYELRYAFTPPGQSEEYGSVALSRDEATALLGGNLEGYRTFNQSLFARYLPEDPSRHRLEGTPSSASPLFGLLVLGAFASMGLALIVAGVRMIRPDTPSLILSSQAGRIRLGNVTYLALPDRAIFRPSVGASLLVLTFGGGFGLITGYLTVFAISAAFNVMFGWEVPGLLTNATSQGQSNPPPIWGLAVLGIGALPGIFAVVMVGMVVHTIQFWCQPPILDYAAGVFRRGRREVCRLSEISEVRLRRFTDLNSPGTTRVGLALALQDGSWRCLEARFSFLDHVGDKVMAYYTDLGALRDGPPQEAARHVAAEIAGRLGVPLTQHAESRYLPKARGF